MVGKRIGNYRVVRQIGKGGMGAVFEAIHDGIGKRVAVKVLHAHFAQDPHIAGRFINEARAVTAITHSGIVQVFDFGQVDGEPPYMVMEYLQGETLSRRLKRTGRMPPVEALRLARQMAAGLAAAHAKHVVHRDLKPGNVIVVPDPEAAGGERAKILDFGIAKIIQESGAGAGAGDRPSDDDATDYKTRSGMLMGTPTYMSPEQCRGSDDTDERSDVYSLGILLYQMLAGRPPFIAEGDGEVLAMQIYEKPVPLLERAPAVPALVAVLVERMLAKKPAARPTMDEVARELDALGSKMSGVLSAVPRMVALASVSGASMQVEVSESNEAGEMGTVAGTPGATRVVSGGPTGRAMPPSTTTRHGIGERVVQAELLARKRFSLLMLTGAGAVGLLGVWAVFSQQCGQQREAVVLHRPVPSPGGDHEEGTFRAASMQVPRPEVTPLTIVPDLREAERREAPHPARRQNQEAGGPKKVAPRNVHHLPDQVAQEMGHPDLGHASPAPVAIAAVAPPVSPAPEPPPTAPRPPAVIRGDKLSGDPPHLPEGVKQWFRNRGPVKLLYKICINREGHVDTVVPLGSSLPEANENIVATLRKWTYRPQPVHVCLMEAFTFVVN